MTIQLMNYSPNKGYGIASKISHNRLHILGQGTISSLRKAILYPEHRIIYTITILILGLSTATLSVILYDYVRTGIEQGLLEVNDPNNLVVYGDVIRDRKN